MKASEVLVSIYESVRSRSGSILSLIQLVEKYRDVSLRSIAKSNLPCVAYCGEFRGRKKNELVKLSGLVFHDIDKLSNVDVVYDLLKRDKHIAVLHKTYSGTGLRVLFYFSELREVKGEHDKEYLRRWECSREYLRDEYQLEVDDSCKDYTRLSYINYSPDIYLNEDADELIVLDSVGIESDVAGINSDINTFGPTDIASQLNFVRVGIERRLGREICLSALEGRDGRKRYSFYFGSYCNLLGIDIDEVMKRCGNERWMNERYLRAAYKRYRESFGKYKYKSGSEVKVLVNEKMKRGKEKVSIKDIGDSIFEEVLRRGEWYKRHIDGYDKLVYCRVIKNELFEYAGDVFKSAFQDYVVREFDLKENVTEVVNHILKRHREFPLLDISKIYYDGKFKGGSFLFFDDGYLYIDLKGEVWFNEYDGSYYLFDGFKQRRNIRWIADTEEVRRLNERQNIFRDFCFGVCGNDEETFDIFRWLYGYIVSGYDIPSCRRAVLFNDVDFEGNGVNRGGTGKSLLCESFRYIRNSVIYPGKNFDVSKDFSFSEPKHNETTGIVVIDDINRSFNFELFYNIITSGLMINKKYQAVRSVDASRYKVVITANHLIDVNENSSMRRVFLFSTTQSIYKANKYSSFTPLDHFNGKQLYNDFTEEDWRRFDLFVMECVRYFLMNRDRYKEIESWLIERSKNDIALSSIGADYAEVFGELFDTGNDKIIIGSVELLERVRATINKRISSHTLTKKLSLWCEKNGYVCEKDRHKKEYRIVRVQSAAAIDTMNDVNELEF